LVEYIGLFFFYFPMQVHKYIGTPVKKVWRVLCMA